MSTPVENTPDDSLAALVFAALDDPHHVDASALIRRADEALTQARDSDGCPDWLYAVRNLANRAIEFGVFVDPRTWQDLEAAAYAANMLFGLHKHHQH